MIIAVVLVTIFGLAVSFVLAVAFEKGPTPSDVAQSYELLWDRLDFDSLWTLSSDALRDSRNRKEFVASKRAAYREQPRLRRVVELVEIEAVAQDGQRVATVLTRLDLRDGAPVHNEIRLERRHGSWRVVAYTLRPETAPAS